jgi:hypothetical protein
MGHDMLELNQKQQRGDRARCAPSALRAGSRRRTSNVGVGAAPSAAFPASARDVLPSLMKVVFGRSA